MAARVCKVEGCDRVPVARNRMCSGHRHRMRAHGNVLAHIPLGAHRWLHEEVRHLSWAEQVEIAYAPSPAEGRGLLWLV